MATISQRTYRNHHDQRGLQDYSGMDPFGASFSSGIRMLNKLAYHNDKIMRRKGVKKGSDLLLNEIVTGESYSRAPGVLFLSRTGSDVGSEPSLPTQTTSRSISRVRGPTIRLRMRRTGFPAYP